MMGGVFRMYHVVEEAEDMTRRGVREAIRVAFAAEQPPARKSTS
jgi:hypothetical protein